MAMKLFEHNQTAYNAAVAMLVERGKAAVIHPTGTGKSFIGFKLCEENPDKRILWLSPSEYIFRTQLENWAAAGGADLDNIIFLTYAKFLMLSEELKDLKPDIEIYDEYHRAGTHFWSVGIERLRMLYPAVPMLGLSATNIRYLDHQRDMTKELFDSNIASEMTLGEAIVRGILKPPQYILSVYSYQKDLEKYEKRVSSVRSKAVRDEAAACLEALRHALENTEGLDVVFDRHMPDRLGKYIVFTLNYDAMQEYIGFAEDWFGKIDKDMHIYQVCSDDPSANKSFRDFMADNSSHLRLLYCMDTLSEGVHTEDISGVILLRPTASPITYKQQIGRTLSASTSRQPVIFDVVNNIEDLYSIDSIKEEMRNAVYYYRSHGGEALVIHDSFEVIDKLAECKELFEQLEGTLAASWDMMYTIAERYYQEHGDLDPPKRWTSPEGYSLGSWLTIQRRVRAGKINGILTDEQIEKLDQLGMRWDSTKDIVWNKYYSAALVYYQANHSLDPGTKYVTEDGVRLGAWLLQLRTARKVGMNSSYLTPEHISQLDEIGMIWDVYDFVFERNYHAAAAYYREHGDLNCKADYVDTDGIKLGMWLNSLRQQYKKRGRAILNDEQFRMLDSIGMCWGSRYDQQWDNTYMLLKSYIDKNGSAKVPVTLKVDGIALGAWLRRQKERFMIGELRDDRIEKLQSLGISLTIADPWEAKFKLAQAYSEAHGGELNVPYDYIADGVWLNKWLNEQKRIGEGKRSKKLTDEQRRKLEAIGMVFGELSADKSWEMHFQAVKRYVEETGNTTIPKDFLDTDGTKLKIWLNRQLHAARKSELADDKAKKLRETGLLLEAVDSFEVGFSHAKAYYEEHGDLLIPRKNCCCSDGYNLSAWLNNTRSRKKKGKLTDAQIERLETIGMVWIPKDDVWNEMFEEAKKFAVEGEPLHIPARQRASNGQDIYDWYIRQRKRYADGKLSDEKIEKLRSIGAFCEQKYAGRKKAPDTAADIQQTENAVSVSKESRKQENASARNTANG